MFTFGLEKERFLLADGEQLIVIPKILPADSEGLQVEFRGQPFPNITDAVFSLLADEDKVKKRIKQLFPNHTLSDAAIMKTTRAIKLAARREYTKGLIKYQNLYGFERHAVSQNESTCGIHISVTNLETFSYENSKGKERSKSYNKAWDFASFIRHMDKSFKDEIKTEKRRPGFYEVKDDGRIEYRSLPGNTNMDKIIEVVSKYNF